MNLGLENTSEHVHSHTAPGSLDILAQAMAGMFSSDFYPTLGIICPRRTLVP